MAYLEYQALICSALFLRLIHLSPNLESPLKNRSPVLGVGFNSLKFKYLDLDKIVDVPLTPAVLWTPATYLESAVVSPSLCDEHE